MDGLSLQKCFLSIQHNFPVCTERYLPLLFACSQNSICVVLCHPLLANVHTITKYFPSWSSAVCFHSYPRFHHYKNFFFLTCDISVTNYCLQVPPKVWRPAAVCTSEVRKNHYFLSPASQPMCPAWNPSSPAGTCCFLCSFCAK